MADSIGAGGIAGSTGQDIDDDFNYDAVTVEGSELGVGDTTGYTGTLPDDFDEENFDSLLRAVENQRERDAPPPVRADLTRLPEVVDDFVRNFFVKHGMMKTLEQFEIEWYERYGSNPDDDAVVVPDVYLENAQLVDKVQYLEQELKKHIQISKKATTLWEHVKKERDFHRMNHNRVMQEKSKMSRDLKRLQGHAQTIEPTVTELRQKYESVQKDKMLLRLECDKLRARIQTLEESVKELEGQPKDAAKAAKPTKAAASNAVIWPPDQRPNPYQANPAKAPTNANGWSCRTSFKAHAMATTRVAIHPKKPVVASCSDDGTWRLHSLPQGELIMSGEGHKDWVAGVSMNSKGTMLATASGDKTIKLWDFATNSCKSTLKMHTEGVWCVQFQETGDLLASGSLDHSARIWDVSTGKCRQTLRGHVDAVNSVCWQPYTNILATASGDKTVSLWDVRANYCVQTFYGHRNAVTSVDVPVAGSQLCSCDAEGNVVAWDMRMIEQIANYDCGPHPANCVAYDKSGTLIAVASDDTTIRMINTVEDKQYTLKGHEDSVQCVAWDPSTNGFLVSCGSDTTVKYWS